ncbi:hypothetical protein B0F90DRAFT_1920145 [Multifurca ochricompacta]|uniref:Uncharacterized protein n=1 Tax=Multifurca ochricompacta TaxID=376703 RepID=A0AAD4QJZ8_9AGAM|nr:hypothetical protein B0F90DRAFT_1920145 [Multifurca ochricompacta]
MFSSPGVEGNSCVPLLDLIDSERSRSQRFSRPRSFSRRDATADSPEGLDPTLSSWLKNINKLSNLIDRLQNLASTAPPEHRPHLYKQVAALRATFKKQQDRCIHFLQLTEEYANRYLLDISAEIQQQSSFLDMLEKRLDMAKTLRGQAVDLRKSYENGTVNAMKKVRETALSQPLPEDFDLLSEVDFVLKEIRRCYIELDKFWIEEIRRAVKAVKTRRVDQEDIQRWRGFQAGLEETIKSWKANAQGGVQTLARVNRPQELEIAKVASRISLGIGLLEESLECVRMSASVEFSKTSMPLILEVNMRFSMNSESCLGFLRRCVDFGKLIAVSCGSFSNDNDCRFARVRGSDDVREGITGLKSETGGEDRSENAEGNVQGYEKALSLEMKVDGKLHRLLELVSSWMTRYDAPPELLSVGELRKVSYGWAKGRDSFGLSTVEGNGMDAAWFYNLSVVREVLKQIYTAERLQPPSSLGAVLGSYSTLWSRTRSISYWREIIKSGEWARLGVYAVEAYGVFKVGEIVGRRSLVGYNVE